MSWTISAVVLVFFPVLFCPVSDSTFSACTPSSVDNIFPFNFMRQMQGILIPSPRPGEEKPTSGGHSQLEDLFWHSLLWNPTHVTFCLNTLCRHGRKGLCEGNSWRSLWPLHPFASARFQDYRLSSPQGNCYLGLGLPSFEASKHPLWKQFKKGTLFFWCVKHTQQQLNEAVWSIA